MARWRKRSRQSSARWSTRMSTTSTVGWCNGATDIRRFATAKESTLATKTAMDSTKSMLTRWKAFGLSCEVGFAPTEAFLKRSCHCIWHSLSSFPMLENGEPQSSNPSLKLSSRHQPGTGYEPSLANGDRGEDQSWGHLTRCVALPKGSH